jgi:hypothetical protein
MWCSKDRFAAKRLRSLSKELQPEKKEVIAANSAFSALLNVSPFNIPNNLIDFVARHITPSLREFKYHRNRIVFNKYMVRKVFGIRCGDRPVQLLNKSDNCELHEVYKGANSRPDLHVAITLLKDCDITDVDTIVRTWDLICLATVVDPGSGNMLGLGYIGSMANPSRTHEYAWDEYLLELSMVEVQKMQKKMGEPVVPQKSEFWITGPYAMLGVSFLQLCLFFASYFFASLILFFVFASLVVYFSMFLLLMNRLHTWNTWSLHLILMLSTILRLEFAM